jgi:hypothetical protein
LMANATLSKSLSCSISWENLSINGISSVKAFIFALRTPRSELF